LPRDIDEFQQAAKYAAAFFADSAIRNPQIAKEKKSLMDGKSRRISTHTH
jgi:hypothetical protein